MENLQSEPKIDEIFSYRRETALQGAL